MMSLWKDRRGSVAIYTAVVGTMMIGSAVLAIDYGRLTVLRTQMQNAADAAALAGAAQLDAQANAINRAIDVAQGAAQQPNGIAGALAVSSVQVLQRLPGTAATTDQNAVFVQVTMEPENANILFQPILDLLSSAGSPETITLTATATARSNPVLCPPPAILACTDQLDALVNISSPDFAGRQLALRQSDLAIEGPFGKVAFFHMLCPPGSPGCNSAQSSAFIASVGANQCSTSTVSVVQGGQSQAAIDDGINPRFADGATPVPAGNVIYYARDGVFYTLEPGELDGGGYGGGDWFPAVYWTDRHGGAALPADLTEATRYQVNLYELGESFARKGKQTLYPVPASVPAGFSTVTSPGISIPTATGGEDPTDEALDGVPDPPAVPSTDFKRRVITAAVGTCEGAADDLSQPIIIKSRFIEMLISERSQDSIIFGEVIGPVTPQNSPNFHTNVQLVE